MRKWTPEERAKQAEAIRRTKPWEQSTGPKTPQGKARSKMNALKHGQCTAEFALLRYGLRQQRDFVRGIAVYMYVDAKLQALLRERTDKKGG